MNIENAFQVNETFAWNIETHPFEQQLAISVWCKFACVEE